VIRLEGVEKIYRAEPPRVALRDVNLRVRRGEFVAIVGRSGSGKTTILNLIGTLSRPTAGEITLDQQNVARMSERERAALRNGKIGYVFQSFNILPDLTAVENVLLPARLAPRKIPDAYNRALAALERVSLKDRADSYPSSLSGGAIQRVAIARALMMKPAILLADEPTGNLDSETSLEIVELFRSLHKEEGLTLLVVTHEEPVSRVADRVLHIEAGRICENDE